MKLWRIDYVVGNTYKAKFVKARSAEEAIRKSRVKDPVDVQIEREVKESESRAEEW